MERRQKRWILEDLEKKIVFVVGPRQVGKTWLAKELGREFENFTYLNYDHFEDRAIIENQSWLSSTELLVLDELHKKRDWKNYLKGLYDTKPDNLKILVTGSARLDLLRSVGDSLAGRFFTHRLLPFSPAELQDHDTRPLAHFLKRGGFPEPFLAEDVIASKRWRKQYLNGLLTIDLLDYQQIQDFRAIHLILEILRRSVGSPLSLTSIARDVAVAPNTVRKYIQILEALYIVFRITPFSKNIARSLLKEPKVYFYDSALVHGGAGQAFENLMALCLLKHVFAMNDHLGEDYELQYLRTRGKKEIDFCLCKNGAIELAVETKVSDSALSPSLHYFCKKYQLKGLQVVENLRREKEVSGIQILGATNYLKSLYL